ncbi:MAG: energy transducer TonB [Candidatus Rokuibacteriota bacterium]
MEPPFGGQAFSLLRPKIELPPLPNLPLGGGTRREGDGAGESGHERDGQAPIPLNTPDPRYADYFLEIKKRIEARLVYPSEAAQKRQSGQLVLEFLVKKDGTLQLVELARSSGVGVLDSYSLNTIKLSAPFPPIPERMGLDSVFIRANFTYVLEGFRIFGFR